MEAPKKRPIVTAAREVKRPADGWKAAPAALELLFIQNQSKKTPSISIKIFILQPQGGVKHVRGRRSTTACSTSHTGRPTARRAGETRSSARSDGECAGGVGGGDGVDGSCEGGYVACAGGCEGEGGTACGGHDGEDGATDGCRMM